MSSFLRRTAVIVAAACAACGERERVPSAGAEAAGGTAEVTVFFTRGDSAVAVRREVRADSADLEGALRQLLRGPTRSERAAGLQSWFSDETARALRSVTLAEAGVAIIDFEDLRPLIPNASSSAGSAMLLRELDATVFAHGSVQTVEYRIEGSCDIFGDWLQYGCLKRERGNGG